MLPRTTQFESLMCLSNTLTLASWALTGLSQPSRGGLPTILRFSSSYTSGYLNRIQSSRRLEKETQRNVELMWLLGRLTPGFKAIARFRKDNGKAIRKVCSQFMLLCRQLNLFFEAMVAIDGSKFKAVNNRDRNYTANKVARRREQIETSIWGYLSALETADLQESNIAEAKTGRLQEK